MRDRVSLQPMSLVAARASVNRMFQVRVLLFFGTKTEYTRVQEYHSRLIWLALVTFERAIIFVRNYRTSSKF